ncbi:DHH family phosphoesterase [Sulfurospirillum arsenophilum]|uniref:DHH family phosphoesterase n=1 Tax=Sulfurospirillum arsenophilum TaxID=56698 RepID=UPI0005A92287|nr:3'-to-5' oligoribonuclease B [Sulfurospirillum arsenophilum]
MNYTLHHLSHTDLDGYSCQMVSAHYFDSINFYNSNYGKEINECFNQILATIQTSSSEKHVILITDLNLTMDQAKEFESKVSICDKEIMMFVLDHHKTGQECADAFEWYFLDSSRCATKITYDFFSALYGKDEKLSQYVDVVNSVDIWLENEPEFELGKVCMGLVSGAKEVNKIMFPEENSKYIFSILTKAQEYFTCKDAHIALDDAIHEIKKAFFRTNNNNTLSNLVSAYNVILLTKNREKMQISYKEYKGILTYNIGNVSVIGNDFLTANPDLDFFMDITSKKTISLRSNGKVDVSKIAAQIANGGGHHNASGGLLSNFKDAFIYDNIKSQVMSIIANKG